MSAILTLNAGSSSLKFALFDMAADGPIERARGQVDRIGGAGRFTAQAPDGATLIDQARDFPDHQAATTAILDWLTDALSGRSVAAVGHRIVHGGPDFDAPIRLDDATLAKLKTLIPLAPLHQPFNLKGVAAAAKAFPDAVQIGCFDTAFHRGHPWVNDVFALPREWYDRGVRRYGFHGLSYEYVCGRLREIAPMHAAGRLVVAHLGNGASMCAIRDGRSVGSTMGFTALDGLPMGTRSGQIDPGVLLYMMQEHGLDADAITSLLYKESGLKGLSGLSHDMRTLEAAGTPEAAEALDYFVFRIRRELGAMTAILGGIDAFA
ncbi:MAG: acetate/propionate family kinase, partial [Pseudomonadota bacterium]